MGAAAPCAREGKVRAVQTLARVTVFMSGLVLCSLPAGPVVADHGDLAGTSGDLIDESLGGGEQPAAEVREVPQSVPSCDLGGVTSWVDVYTTEYVWNTETQAWDLGEETGPVRMNELFTPYIDQELAELCAPAQPEPIVDEVSGSQASCKIRGSLTWVDIYTTEWVWNVQTSSWELGEPNSPERTEETFIAYTDEELADLCPKVGGEYDETPGQPEVPTVVDAGLGLQQAGLQVAASTARVEEGNVLTLRLGASRLGLRAQCRVVCVVDQDRRSASASGTPPAHPESAEVPSHTSATVHWSNIEGSLVATMRS